jgi:hypothetical protein
VLQSCPTVDGFTFSLWLDSRENDIEQIIGDVATIGRACAANANCRAFNIWGTGGTNGWLKHLVRPASDWNRAFGSTPCAGLYVKGGHTAN